MMITNVKKPLLSSDVIMSSCGIRSKLILTFVYNRKMGILATIKSSDLREITQNDPRIAKAPRTM